MAKKKTAPKGPHYPETLYAAWRGLDDLRNPPYILADPDAGALVEKGTRERVGVYRLVGFAEVENKTEVLPAGPLKAIGALLLVCALGALCALRGSPASAQTTQPAAKARPLVGVYAQVVESMDRWDPVVDVYVGWSSYKNTQGKDLAADRAEQLRWRKTVAARGKKYVDAPTPDWRWAFPTAADVRAMADDPACLGVLFMDEPDQYILGPSGKWDTFRVPVETYKAFAAAVDAGDPAKRLRRVGNFTGQGITPVDGVNLPRYVPYFALLTDVSSDWYPRNTDAARYPLTYPALAVSLTRRAAPAARHWAVLECSWQGVSKAGASPSGDDIRAQGKAVIEGGADALVYFPQKILGGYVADNTTAEQFAAVVDVVKSLPARSAPGPPPPAGPDPAVEVIKARVGELEARVARAEAAAERGRRDQEAFRAWMQAVPAPTTQPGN